MIISHGSHISPPTQPHHLLKPQQLVTSPPHITFSMHPFHSRKIFCCSKRLIGVQGYETSSSSHLSSSYSVSEDEERKVGEKASGDVGIEALVCENGWRVRRMVEDQNEMKGVARVQAEAFHEPVFFMDDLFFRFFQAEVLAALLYRIRNSPPDRYACLIAEPESSESALQGEIVGVVDLTVSRDGDVLKHVQGDQEYLYVSGIAVSHKFRRQKVATALLKACEMVSALWGFKYLALRAYESDLGARTLYANAGYQVVSGDPHWNTTWIGRKRRVVMIKQCNDLL